MAGTFGCDQQAADRMSGELAQIRSDMASMGRIFQGYDGATGSKGIEGALEGFFSDSSDNREKMDALLERASGLLGGLAEGTAAVDKSLADSLEPKGDQPGVSDAAPAVGGGRR